MTDLKPALERLRDQLRPPPGSFERLVARRRRRRRNQRLAVSTLAFVVAAAGVTLAVRALGPTGGPRPAAHPALSGSDVVEVPPRGETAPAFLADGHPVFVVHHEDGTVSVVDAFSTHRPWGVEELIGWCPSSRTFDEPEHGAKFNEYGQYLAGPASADLAYYEIGPTGSQVDVGSAVVPTTRSENPRVGFQGKLCADTEVALNLHQIPRSAVFDSPAEAVETGPGGWIALRGVLLVRAGEQALLCATVEGGSCTSPAIVEGIDSEAWLDFLGRSQVGIESEWIARVEGDHLISLTRTGLG
jgi:Rieske [2Fe-2S] domain